MVCTPCHKSLGSAGLSVGATGEFRVPTAEEAMLIAGESDEPGERPNANGACSWCNKPESSVKKLIGRAGTALCNECVSLASDIMDAELGDDWR